MKKMNHPARLEHLLAAAGGLHAIVRIGENCPTHGRTPPPHAAFTSSATFFSTEGSTSAARTPPVTGPCSAILGRDLSFRADT
jgi:hypothetical protein